MMNEKQKILEMLESGQITAQEAAQLLDCIDPQTSNMPLSNGVKKSNQSVSANGKKLRVQVNGDTKDAKKINVNVSIPLTLARLADNIIANCMPTAASDELKKQGIDLKSLNLGDMVGTLETMEEDIVNADVDNEEAKIKVRVYVE